MDLAFERGALPKRDTGDISCWVSEYSLPVQCMAYVKDAVLARKFKTVKSTFDENYISFLVFFPSHCRTIVRQ